MHAFIISTYISLCNDSPCDSRGAGGGCADEVMDQEEEVEDVGAQAASNIAYDYANLAAAMDDGDAASSEGGWPAGSSRFSWTLLQRDTPAVVVLTLPCS